VILELLHAAARGTFPPEDGRTEVVPAAAGAGAAVLSFTAHHVVAAGVPAGEVLAHVDPGNLNGPLAPGARTGLRAGSLDVVVAWAPCALAVAPLREIDPGDHPRVVRARRWRSELRVFEGDGGIVLVGRGLAAANAASLRALQPAGFAAVGAEVLFGPGEDFFRRDPGSSGVVI
jgi:hypothetical protein